MESKKQLFEIISNVSEDRAEYLNALFKYLPEAVIKEMTYFEVEKGNTLVSSGDFCETVYVLLKGNVEGLEYQNKGQLYSFMDFTQMYIIGDFEVFADYTDYCVTVRATEDCKLLKIPAHSYLRWIQHDDNALFLRLKDILNTITVEIKMDREYILMGCKERLVNYLIRLYDKYTDKKQNVVKVMKTQSELAEKIGFNVRSVQRSIVSLEEAGYISMEGGKIIITHEQYTMMKQYRHGKEK